MPRKELMDWLAVLRTSRKQHGLTQEALAERLGISRKTCLLLEQGAWLPQERARAHFVKALLELDPAVAQAFLDFVGDSIEEHTVLRPAGGTFTQATRQPLDAEEAKRAFDLAVYTAAEELDMSAKALRPIAAMLLARLDAAEMTLTQAAQVANAHERSTHRKVGRSEA